MNRSINQACTATAIDSCCCLKVGIPPSGGKIWMDDKHPGGQTQNAIHRRITKDRVLPVYRSTTTVPRAISMSDVPRS